MPKIRVNDTQLYYELHGPEDKPVLVLSNGVLMSTVGWTFQTPVLSKHFRLLLYDCRGMWQSDHPPGPYSMDQHADDLAALLDALEIKRAHIGGASYGAEISMVFALKYPDRTQSLIVTSAVSQVQSLLEGMINSWDAAAISHDSDMLFKLVYPLTFSEEWIDQNQAILNEARERYKKLDFDAFHELLQAFKRLDITGELKNISAPTIVIVGEHDLIKPRMYSEIIADAVPSAEFAIIPHAGHAAMWERPGIFNSLVIGFISKHSKVQ